MMDGFPSHWKRPVFLPPNVEYTPIPEPQKSVSLAIDPWRDIHRYPIENAATWSPEKASRRYQSWLALVPQFKPDGASCGCQTHWAELTKEFPPDFSSPEAFERWVFDRHDDVSRLHSGAKRISWEQSQRLWRGPRVGFMAATYQEIGGTETFHRTLLPELRHLVRIAGFHATSCPGDTSLLKVPYYQSRKELIDQCDTIITWGIDDIRDCAGKMVISVHHADTGSDWSDRLQLLPEINLIVCVSKDVPSHLSKLTSTPSVCIPNGVKRTEPSGRRVRDEFVIGDRKIVLWPHRWSNEKQPELAMKVAKCLPEDYVMVMTDELREIDPKIFFVGKQGNIADWLIESKCVLSLSTYEGFGYSVAEAMIAGVPVVSYERGVCNSGNSTIIPANATAEEIANLCCSASAVSSDTFPVDEWVNRWSELIHKGMTYVESMEQS